MHVQNKQNQIIKTEYVSLYISISCINKQQTQFSTIMCKIRMGFVLHLSCAEIFFSDAVIKFH